MEVGGLGWLSSANINLTVSPYFTLMKSAANSASAADDATNFKKVQRVKIAPLNVMGSPYLETEPGNKCPDARLLAFFAERYNASEWMFNIIYDA